MGLPRTINVEKTITAGDKSVDVLSDKDATFDKNTLVRVYATREVVEITVLVKAGAIELYNEGGCDINTTNGSSPAVPDTMIVNAFVPAGQKLQMLVSNTNAADKEFRAKIFSYETTDVQAYPGMLDT